MSLMDTHYYEPESDPEHMRLAQALEVIKSKWEDGIVLTDQERRDMGRAFQILRDKGFVKQNADRRSGFDFTKRGLAMLHLIDSLHGNTFLQNKEKLEITDLFREMLMHRFSKNLEMFQMEKENFHQAMKDELGTALASQIAEKKITREAMDILGKNDNPLFKAMYLTMEIKAQLDAGKEFVEIEGDTIRPREEHKGMVASALDFMMSDARVFHCSEPVKEMLTETKNKIGKRRLPFPIMFINTDFNMGDRDIFGILIFQVHGDKGDLVYCRDPKCPEQDEQNHGFGVFAIGFKKKDKSLRYGYGTVSPNGGLQFTKDRFMKKVGIFACNFLDFLLDPNVRFVKADGSVEPLKGSHKGLRNAYEQKRIDLSKTYFVKIAQPLQKYIDQWVRMSTGKGYSHKFWVRGHFRRLKADRYGENVGKKLWIAPFIKGKGVLLHKEYDVNKGGG